MTQANPAPALSPDLVKQSIALARALSAAARNWALYPPEHPAVMASVRRLAEAVTHGAGGGAFMFGVTPKTLLVAGLPLPEERPVTEAARLLHERYVLSVSFLADLPVNALERFLKVLAMSPEDLRSAGGPAQIWNADGHPGIAIEQIDYAEILEDKDIAVPADRKDDVWRSLVSSIVRGNHEFTELQQARLLEIAHNSFEIGELAAEVVEPKRNLDGSPLITTQAATVLAVFRHLSGIVAVMEPERLPEVMRNVAAATGALDPHVVLRMIQMDEGAGDASLVRGITAAFDDEQVAHLLATALSRDGKATARLAEVFDTIAPDESRKRRVLTMARSMLSEQDFGRAGQFRAVWSSMETLLLSYDETPYVSAGYQASLEGAAARGEMLAGRDLPPELPEWVESLEQDNVRSLSVMLITDLLRLEDVPERAADITRDMVALLDDLLMAGDFANARLVLQELQRASGGTVAAAAARAALTNVADSAGIREATGLLGDLDEEAATAFGECCRMAGPSVVASVLPALQCEQETVAFRRAREIISHFGGAAAPYLAVLADDTRWFVQRNGALLLGAIRSADAVPPLQALLRKNDPRVLRPAIAGLAGIDDPSAARAVQTALRAMTGENRTAVVEALVAERDPRVVPMLVKMISEIDPFGPDHEVLLDALEAVRQLGDERAVPSVASVMRRKKWFGGKKAQAFKTASVRALAAIGTPRAASALDEAAKTGDRVLKRVIGEVRR
jgi:HEAT repeat protein